MWDCENCGQRAIISPVCPVCFKEPGMPRNTVDGGYSDQTLPAEPEVEEVEDKRDEPVRARKAGKAGK